MKPPRLTPNPREPREFALLRTVQEMYRRRLKKQPDMQRGLNGEDARLTALECRLRRMEEK